MVSSLFSYSCLLPLFLLSSCALPSTFRLILYSVRPFFRQLLLFHHSGPFISLFFSFPGFHTRYFAFLSVVYPSFPGVLLLFSWVAPTIFLAATIVGLSLAFLLTSLRLPIGFSRMRFPIPCTCCPCRSPLLVASCLFPSFRDWVPLLPSSFSVSFTCAVFRGSFYRRSSSLGVVRASALAFFSLRDLLFC